MRVKKQKERISHISYEHNVIVRKVKKQKERFSYISHEPDKHENRPFPLISSQCYRRKDLTKSPHQRHDVKFLDTHETLIPTLPTVPHHSRMNHTTTRRANTCKSARERNKNHYPTDIQHVASTNPPRFDLQTGDAEAQKKRRSVILKISVRDFSSLQKSSF